MLGYADLRFDKLSTTFCIFRYKQQTILADLSPLGSHALRKAGQFRL